MCRGSSSSSTTTTTTTMANQLQNDDDDVDSKLFGSLVTELTDELTSNLNAALSKGIQTLPMLDDPQRSQQLQTQLQKAFYRNIDLLELYAQRNIFTLQNFPPLQRAKIARLVLDPDWDPEAAVALMEEADAAEEQQQQNESTTATKETPMPTKNEIPSPAQLKTTEQELLGRRQHLQSLQEKRLAMEKRLRELEAATQLVDLAGLLPSGDNSSSSDSIPEVVEAAANASELQQQGQALAQRMEQVKRQRENEHPDRNSNQIVYPQPKHPPGRKKMALAERYAQDRAAAVTASADTLAKVQALVRND